MGGARPAPALAASLALLLALGATAAAEDEPAPDLLGGFGDDLAADESASASRPLRGGFWELTGSLSLASSINFLPHRSLPGNTNYQGLSKLRSRLNLQLDLELPRGWELRAQGFGYYDWAYLIRDRSDYTPQVLRQYEWDADTQDFWIRGTLFGHTDLKLGRQVVNWGRSETLRVLDVLNPLDNREPGIADIEDLRRPVTMARFDHYRGDWNLSVVAIPEIRFNQNPPPGSDFFAAPPGGGIATVEEKPDSLRNWEVGVGLTGIFEGWDLSFHGAWYYDDLPVLQSVAPLPAQPGILVHKRLWMLGSGGNYTLGSWLLKGEIAYVDGVGFTDADDRSRLDVMAGVEYYGFADTSISLEALNRHVFDFPGPSPGSGGGMALEDATAAAIRITRSFWRERLDVTALALLLVGDDEVGSVLRLQAAYDLREALVLTGGVVLYTENDVAPLSSYGPNDRFFFELKWSF